MKDVVLKNKGFTLEVVIAYLDWALAFMRLTPEDMDNFVVTVKKTKAHIATSSLYYDGRISLNFPTYDTHNSEEKIAIAVDELLTALRYFRLLKFGNASIGLPSRESIVADMPKPVRDMMNQWLSTTGG